MTKPTYTIYFASMREMHEYANEMIDFRGFKLLAKHENEMTLEDDKSYIRMKKYFN